MKLIQQQVPAADVLRMIDTRMEKVTMQYEHARGTDNRVEAEAMAETKWQLAELKMQFADLLVEQVEAGLHRAV